MKFDSPCEQEGDLVDAACGAAVMHAEINFTIGDLNEFPRGFWGQPCFLNFNHRMCSRNSRELRVDRTLSEGEKSSKKARVSNEIRVFTSETSTRVFR